MILSLIDPSTKIPVVLVPSITGIARGRQFKYHAKTRQGPVYDWIRSINSNYTIEIAEILKTKEELEAAYQENLVIYSRMYNLLYLGNFKSYRTKTKLLGVLPTKSTDKDIATTLGIHTRTVTKHLKDLRNDGTLTSELEVKVNRNNNELKFYPVRTLTVVQS